MGRILGGIAGRQGRRAAGRAVLLSLLLAACGPLSVGTGAGPAKVTLRVMMTDDWSDTPPFISAIRSFESAHPAVRIEIDKLPVAEVLDTLEASIAQDAPPDVVQGHAFAAAARGLAQPIDDLWRSSRLTTSEFLPSAVDDVRWDGRLYGVPLDTTAVVLFYNAAHFAEAGLPPPTAWTSFADLEQAAAALTRPDGSRRGLALSGSTWRAFAWMAANGGRLVDHAGGRPTFTLDDARNIQALRSLRGLVERGLAYYPTPGVVVDDALALLRAGAASMYTSGAFDLVTLAKSALPGDGPIEVAMLPPGPGAVSPGSAVGGSSLFIPERAPNRALAFDFIQLLTADRSAARFAREEARLPARQRVLDEVTAGRPDLQTVTRQLASARTYGIDAFPIAEAAFKEAVQNALSGRADPRTALRAAQRRVEGSAP